MKSIFLVLSGWFFFSLDGACQGAWSLNHLPLDSLNDSYIGREVRIDFKSSPQAAVVIAGRNIRRMFSKRDTATLTLAGGHQRFVEAWRVYVDHGALDDQTLQSVGGDSGNKFIIKEMFVRAIDDDTITVEVYIYRPNVEERESAQMLSIGKNLINGIVIEEI